MLCMILFDIQRRMRNFIFIIFHFSLMNVFNLEYLQTQKYKIILQFMSFCVRFNDIDLCFW